METRTKQPRRLCDIVTPRRVLGTLTGLAIGTATLYATAQEQQNYIHTVPGSMLAIFCLYNAYRPTKKSTTSQPKASTASTPYTA